MQESTRTGLTGEHEIPIQNKIIAVVFFSHKVDIGMKTIENTNIFFL